MIDLLWLTMNFINDLFFKFIGEVFYCADNICSSRALQNQLEARCSDGLARRCLGEVIQDLYTRASKLCWRSWWYFRGRVSNKIKLAHLIPSHFLSSPLVPSNFISSYIGIRLVTSYIIISFHPNMSHQFSIIVFIPSREVQSSPAIWSTKLSYQFFSVSLRFHFISSHTIQ